jgi:hypothetical protein
VSSPPPVIVSVTTGGGVGWEVTAGGVSVDVVVVVEFSAGDGCWVDSGDGSVETEGEGSTTAS